MEKYSLFKGETYEQNYERLMAELGNRSLYSDIKHSIIYGLKIRSRIAHVLRLCNQDVDTIERIKDLRLLHDPIGRSLFQAFLTIGDRAASGDELRNLECYDECQFVLKNATEKFNDDYLDYFYSLAPDFGWESRAKHAFSCRNELKNKIGIDMIIGLRNACIWSILISFNFNRFKRDLRSKTKAIKKMIVIMIKEEERLKKATYNYDENVFKKLQFAEDKYKCEGLYD